MKRISLGSFVTATSVVALMAAQPSLAQDQDADDIGLIEEVIVTAQKRAQSMQDIGISVSAFTGNDLKDRGIDGIKAVQDVTPNLRINNAFGGGNPQYSIRGVGELTDDSTLSSSPVAVHVNEVPIPYPVTTTNLLFDLERIEVLRGPQGDLFGLNTTGGTINYITAKPTKETVGGLLAEYGRFGRYKVEGYLSGPLSETFSVRLAVSHSEQTKGWQHNVVTGEELGEFRKTGARLSLRFEPTETLRADIEAHWSEEESDGMGLRLRNVFDSLVDGYIPFQSTPVDDFYGTKWGTSTFDLKSDKPYIDREGKGASANIEWELGSVILNSVTGYDEFERDEWFDWDGEVVQDSDQIFISDLWTFSQELRLSSNTDGPLTWLVGANYGKDSIDQTTIFDIHDNPDFPAAGGQAPHQEREIWAIFGHSEYQITDRWNLTLGLRYTDESRNITNQGTFLFADANPGFTPADLIAFGLGGLGLEPLIGNGLLQDLTTLTSALFGSGDIYLTNPTNPLLPGSPLSDADFTCFAFVGGCFEGVILSDEISASEWSGKIGLDYEVNDDWLVYASASRGFKSGGFLDTAASVASQFVPTKPETLWAYELGAKGTFAGGRARLNTAVFYYDYKDQQVADSIVDPLFGALGALVNAPKSTLWGFETELTWRVTENFEIQQSVGFTKGKFKEFTSIDAAAVQIQAADPLWDGIYRAETIDLSGEPIQFPKWQLSGIATYTQPVSDKFELLFSMDYSYESTSDSPNPDFSDGMGGFISRDLDSHLLVNGRIALMSEDGWEVSLFGHNIFGEKYVETRGPWNRGIVESVGMRSTWGVRAKYDF